MHNYLMKALHAFDMSVQEWLKLDDPHTIEKIWNLAAQLLAEDIGRKIDDVIA